MTAARLALWVVMALALVPASACSAAPPDLAWPAFKAAYVTADGRVLDVEAGVVSHTEGQGWGMLLAEASGDRDAFDRLWDWTEHHLARPDVRLFSWRYDPAAAAPVTDANNASDGDMLIAWALMRAGQRWPSGAYAAPAADIRRAIAEHLIVHIAGRSLIIPGLQGFTGADYALYNPSYFVLPALESFATADPQGPWTTLIKDGLVLAEQARFGPDRLTADWVRIGADGQVSPAPGHPPQFGFDALRAPFYLVWGGARANPLVDSARRYWSRVTTPGHRPPAWVDVTTGAVAPYPLSEGGVAIAEVVGAKRAAVPKTAADHTYYSEILVRLAALARSEVEAKRFSAPP